MPNRVNINSSGNVLLGSAGSAEKNNSKNWGPRFVSNFLDSENIKKVGAVCIIVFEAALILTGAVLLGLISGGVIPTFFFATAVVLLGFSVCPNAFLVYEAVNILKNNNTASQ